MKTKRFCEISERALIQRIQRALSQQGQQLKKTRGGVNNRNWTNLGDYWILGIDRNLVISTHVDIESFGKELGVLQDYEKLADD